MRFAPRLLFVAHATPRWRQPAFTLIELLVVVAIVALLISILAPTLSTARRKATATRCLAHLRVLGQGIVIYETENQQVMPAGRLPKIDDCNAGMEIRGGVKYRPTFVAMMSTAVGAPPFDDPAACKNEVDLNGEVGDRQNYDYDVYVCPAVADWTDERNGSYGYNYQFLGNSRVFDPADPTRYKNWPVKREQIRYASRTVAAGDCMGTAASWPSAQRRPYENNGRDADQFGNEGFNLDPPRVDPVNGEMANFDSAPQSRTAADPRHLGLANILWLDGHADAQTLPALGYRLGPLDVVEFDGENVLWSGSGRDEAWTPDYRP